MQKSYSLENVDDKITYLNTSIFNSSEDYQQAYFTASRNDPILSSSAGDYNMSIIRFKIPSNLIPIFNFIPQPGTLTSGNTNPNLGIYSITYSYNGVDHQEFLQLQPGQQLPLPNIQPLIDWTKINSSNYNYYTIFSYTFFMTLINQALAQGYYYCLNNAPFNTSPPVTTGVKNAPYLSFDPATGLFSLIASEQFSSNFVSGPTISIYFNHPLFDFFQSFNSTGFLNQSNGKFAKISIFDDGHNFITRQPPVIDFYLWSSTISYSIGQVSSFNNINYVSITNGNIGNQPDISPGNWSVVPNNIVLTWESNVTYNIGDIVVVGASAYYISLTNGNINNNPTTSGTNWRSYTLFNSYQMQEEYTTLSTWSVINKIVIASSSFPINTEQIADYDLNNSISEQFYPIVTDFEPTILTPTDNKSYFQYFANPFRFTNMNGTSRITYFDYNIFWVDNQGTFFQLYIDRKSLVSVKFLFQKKLLRS